ncbi:MAG: thiamine pyrophosphate-binding protein, partial [candidate division NC10 bacterium]|nr:thiamine pyrophosphate-binding protein [candidate division NC10 bacterium]
IPAFVLLPADDRRTMSLRRAAVERFSRLTGIPALPMESPRGTNDPWLHGAAARLAGADVILLCGKKLDFAVRFGEPPAFAPACRFIQVDAEPDALRPGGPVALALAGEPSAVIDRLTGAARGRAWRHAAWGEEIRAARASWPAGWEALRASARRPIHPLRVCAALQPLLDGGGVLVSDGGEFGQWMQAGLDAETRLINGLSGSIGSALPMALAARLALPERRVIATLGDGTFGFHAFELDTAARHGLPVVAVVGNDGRWNAEHQLQLRDYRPDRTVGCELRLSRYDRVAEALGGHGEHVERPEDLEPALARAVASALPACVNVVIEGAAAPTYTSAGH